jgi:hypothetical protein
MNSSPSDSLIGRAFFIGMPQLGRGSHFFVASADLALHGHKKAAEAAHLFSWPADVTHSS